MVTDANLIMARAHLKSIIPHTVTEKWVLGHASEKKKHAPETITPLERDNSECDADAEQCIQSGIPPCSFTPFPGYRAMLKLDGRCVTTHFRESVEYANASPAMIEYATARLNIDDAVFHSINWTSIGRVRTSHKIERIARTSKMMYRWLPVGHNWYKCNLATDVCPCCGATDETFEHLLACKHDDLGNVRRTAYIKV